MYDGEAGDVAYVFRGNISELRTVHIVGQRGMRPNRELDLAPVAPLGSDVNAMSLAGNALACAGHGLAKCG